MSREDNVREGKSAEWLKWWNRLSSLSSSRQFSFCRPGRSVAQRKAVCPEYQSRTEWEGT